MLPDPRWVDLGEGTRLFLVSSLPDFASRNILILVAEPLNSTCVLEALPGKLDIKKHSHSILYASNKM